MSFKPDEKLNEVERRMRSMEASLEAHSKQLQTQESNTEDHEIRFDKLEEEISWIQDEVNKASEEEK